MNDGFINNFRNIVVWFIAYLILVYIGFFSSGLLLMLLFKAPELSNLDLVLSTLPVKYFFTYIKWLRDNFSQIGFFGPNLYFIKIILSGTLTQLFIIFLIYYFRHGIYKKRPFQKERSLHGDARWAEESDIRDAGLREKKGMLLGKDKRGYLIAGGYQHALLFAPTGSGKGVGFVIPNLLYWDDSVFVHDIKLENYELTSGYRKEKMGQEVYVWSPADSDGNTHCYNPIDWVSEKPGQMVDDVQKIANLLMPDKDFWVNEARSLFLGVVLYLLAVKDKVKSFGEVVRTMRSDDVVYNLAVVLDTLGQEIHPVGYMNIAAFLQKAEKERSGVISTMNSSLELWANPLIDTATASSDFNIIELY